MNALYQLADHIEAISSGQNRAIDEAFRSIFVEENLDAMNSRFRILATFEDSLSEVSLLGIPARRIDTMQRTISKLKGDFLRACCLGTTAEFAAAMQSHTSVPLLHSFGDTIAAAFNNTQSPLNREAFIADTLVLLESLQSSNLPEYPKSVLVLEINAIIRIVSECLYMSDNQIRARVKTIFADFCAEFSSNDKLYESTREKVFRWTKNAAGAGVAVLGLTSNVSSVVALLAPPKG